MSNVPSIFMGLSIDRTPSGEWWRAFGPTGWLKADTPEGLLEMIEHVVAPDGVFAVWSGGSSYAPSGAPDDVERFGTREEAVQALVSRCRDGHWCRQDFMYINRDPESVFTPNADDGAYIDLFWADPSGALDPIPDERIEHADLNIDGTPPN